MITRIGLLHCTLKFLVQTRFDTIGKIPAKSLAFTTLLNSATQQVTTGCAVERRQRAAKFHIMSENGQLKYADVRHRRSYRNLAQKLTTPRSASTWEIRCSRGCITADRLTKMIRKMSFKEPWT